MLASGFHLRSPFSLKRLPRLARFYCHAYYHATPSWRSRARRALFRVLYSLRPPSVGEFDYERLGRVSNVRFDARNLQFQSLYAPWCRHGYEPEVALLIDALLPEAGTFLDIGSNWGYFTLYAASNRENLHIHAFEPLPGSYRDLTSCVEQTGLSGMVTCHHLALSSADSEAFIQVPDGLHSGQAQISGAGGKVRVRTQRLDTMKLPPPDVIKMDVEGHELEVLRGAADTLRSARPFLLFESKPIGPHALEALEPMFFLRSLGYRLYAPVLQHAKNGRKYNLPPYWCEPGPDDLLVLFDLEPEGRLLWPVDLNVLACHESLLARLAAKFDRSA